MAQISKDQRKRLAAIFVIVFCLGLGLLFLYLKDAALYSKNDPHQDLPCPFIILKKDIELIKQIENKEKPVVLILDLNSNGIETAKLSAPGSIYFDHNQDDFAEASAWVRDNSDGVLV